jgi:hypothetical protein
LISREHIIDTLRTEIWQQSRTNPRQLTIAQVERPDDIAVKGTLDLHALAVKLMALYK